MGNISYRMLDNRRKGVLKRIAETGPFIMATATPLKVKCGNSKCKCARDKKYRHKKLHLSWTDSKGSGTCYVPVDIRKEVMNWIENYWTVKELMREMTELSRKMIKIYSKTEGKIRKKQQKINREQEKKPGRKTKSS